MKIKLINPNTSLAMTKSVEEAARKHARKDTEIIAVSPARGPESIECYLDDYLAVPGMIEEILKGDREEKADGFIIACFGDPGLQAAREVTDKPVLGIAEAAFSMAKMIAPYFSVVSVLDRSRKMTEDLVHSYGCEKFCRSIRSTGLQVLEFNRDPQKGLEALSREGRKAVEEDGAECILLGCAGFVDFTEKLGKELGVPVLDGVVPAVKLMESLIDMGIRTSKINTWSYSEMKSFKTFEYIRL